MIHEYDLECPYCWHFNNIDPLKNGLEEGYFNGFCYDSNNITIHETCEVCKKDFIVNLTLKLEPNFTIKNISKKSV